MKSNERRECECITKMTEGKERFKLGKKRDIQERGRRRNRGVGNEKVFFSFFLSDDGLVEEGRKVRIDGESRDLEGLVKLIQPSSSCSANKRLLVLTGSARGRVGGHGGGGEK